jgi:hypothetical protein
MLMFCILSLDSCAQDKCAQDSRGAEGKDHVEEGFGSERGPVDGKWLIIRLGAEPSTLNPVLSTDAYAGEICSYIGESPLRRVFGK